MSQNNDRDAAEQECFNYIQKQIGGEENFNAFRGNMLKNEKSFEWCFQLGKEVDPTVNFGFTNGAVTWTVNGEFTAQIRDRTAANRVIDSLHKATPARCTGSGSSEALTIGANITVFNVVDLDPETITIVDKDTKTGDEEKVLVTRVTGQYFVVYRKTTPEN